MYIILAVKRLVLDITDTIDCELIAIHTSLSAYYLAYLINSGLSTKLSRKKEDLHFNYDDITATFEFFQYWDSFKYIRYSLVQNVCRIKQDNFEQQSFNSLFAPVDKMMITKYLVPERKEVDFFLKIETETNSSEELYIKKLLRISQIVTAYNVDFATLKSKNNLIFE